LLPPPLKKHQKHHGGGEALLMPFMEPAHNNVVYFLRLVQRSSCLDPKDMPRLHQYPRVTWLTPPDDFENIPMEWSFSSKDCQSTGSVHIKTYKGCTDLIPRRLRQHNGDLKVKPCYTRRQLGTNEAGLADKTKRHMWNSWVPICLVRGFPTRGHALRFETRFKHLTLSSANGTCAENAKFNSQGRLLHKGVRLMIALCSLPQWTKTCPLARDNPLTFEWWDESYRPAVSSIRYLPPYVHEVTRSDLERANVAIQCLSKKLNPVLLAHLIAQYLEVYVQRQNNFI
jgi:predicted GIY-YIG superfamily endonuclease